MEYCHFFQAIGSSPRMWGTGKESWLIDHRVRFIPTHVGNRVPSPTSAVAAAVHPHACGEQEDSINITHYNSGSSPRMWGTEIRQKQTHHGRRFIPTHVGNRDTYGKTDCTAAVHPHACGEQATVLHILHGSHGSSPRMWGTVDTALALGSGARFIPTHVGNSCRIWKNSKHTAVHPHACGEQFLTSVLFWCNNGSSPRMWGTGLFASG